MPPDWAQWALALLGAGGVGGVITTLIKTRPAMRTVELQGEGALWARIASLEARLEASDERARLAAEDCEKRIDKIEAEKAVLRHERNNLKAGFNAFLALTKRLDNPELSAIAETVEDMVTRGDQAIAIERGVTQTMKGDGA